MSAIPERLDALREAMRAQGLTHHLVPSSDEHLNEYVPEWRQRRPWISGFTGSAGDVLVGLDGAWLFTDGRYHLQAGIELEASGIDLVKVGAPGHPSLLETLGRLSADAVVGFDPMVLAVNQAAGYAAALAERGATWKPVAENPIDPLWTDRPAPPTSALHEVPLAWSGEDAAGKLAAVRARLEASGAEVLPILKLDQIAWLTNLRSKDDIPYNPVFEGFAAVTPDALHLFLHAPEARVPELLRRAVPELRLHVYEEFLPFLEGIESGTRVHFDASCLTEGVRRALETAGATLVPGDHPAEALKAIKNEPEVASMKRANRRASAAKTRALAWVKERLAAGEPVTEKSFREHIEQCYAELEDFWGLSFNSISAAGEHGAIMHYGTADETPLRAGELFLIDSGVQVGGGTTDDTRTIIVGEPTEEHRRCYTLVLKAHIAAASMVFPDGTPGTAIDANCRRPLWEAGLNYDHGTGHGVGCFLNVHEGPFALSERERKPYAVRPLREGMITSIEPGYYRAGWGGIRIENLYRIGLHHTDEDGTRWLAFESLTFIPIELELVDRSLLTPAESAWLDRYHESVRSELQDELPAEVLDAALGQAVSA